VNYLDYLSLPNEEKSRFKMLYTMTFVDTEEIAKIREQSWFQSLRDDLNKGGKISVNFLFAKYEQSGTQSEMSARDSFKLAEDIIRKAEILSVEDLCKHLDNKLKGSFGGFFEPSLVVVDGMLVMPFTKSYFFDSLMRTIGSRLGYRVEGSPIMSVVDNSNLTKLLYQVYSEIYKESFNEYLKEHFDPARDLMHTRYFGRDYIQAYLLNPSKDHAKDRAPVQFETCCPISWSGSLSRNTEFNCRVLGWLRHAGLGRYFIEAVALAQVDVF
jgi:hypothetical protein